MKIAGKKVAISDIARAGQETGRIDHPARAYRDAVTIDQIDLAVGREGSVQKRGLAAEDTVQDRTGGRRLDEFGQLTRVD